MYMKSLVSLAVLGAMSAVATAGDHVVFDKPNESYTVDGLSIFGATINASDIGSVRISVSGEVIPGAAQRGCPLYLRCSMPDLMR